jgi:hypothetical protein
MIQLSGSKPDESGKIFSASVHKELLCFFSPYYAAALKGGFAEATSNTLTLDLPNDRMADVVSWLYSGTIISEEEIDLMKLYVFADEKMMLAFRRSIMSKLICITSISCPMDAEDAIPYLKRLPENCGMFRYLVDFWAGVWCETESVYGMEDMDHDKRIPRTFFYRAMEKLSRIVSYEHTRANTLKAACNFHEHVNYHEWADSMSLPSSSSLTHVLVLTKQLVATRPQHRRSRATVQKIPTTTKSEILSARYSAWEDLTSRLCITWNAATSAGRCFGVHQVHRSKKRSKESCNSTIEWRKERRRPIQTIRYRFHGRKERLSNKPQILCSEC